MSSIHAIEDEPNMNVARRQTQRQRQRIACESCRERKRKCDGNRPCNLCIGYGYECAYRSTPRTRHSQRVTSRSETVFTQEGSPSGSAQTPSRIPESESSLRQERVHSLEQPSPALGIQNEQGPPCYLRSVESNSGAAFVRLLTMTLESSSSSVSPMRMLAWNLFLGERQAVVPVQPDSLTTTLSELEMQNLAGIYFDKFHPCYGFVAKEALYRSISETWDERSRSDGRDAMLCGVAAIACIFSDAQHLPTEQKLVALAKRLLDPSTAGPPSRYLATAWLLRTVYLRLTAKPEEAWMASCTTMHMIDAALSANRIGGSTLTTPAHDLRDTPDVQTNLCGVAQHLNIWLSYDLGRSRIVLPSLPSTPPSPTPGEYTSELLTLLPHSTVLDPTNTLPPTTLLTTLTTVLASTHTEPPSILAQTNLSLCIARRLHSSKTPIPPPTLQTLFTLMLKSTHAVHSALARNLPWHHVANIPFQLLCLLLALDTPQSFALLADVLRCVSAVGDAYPTEATREAVAAARTLLRLHRRRREGEVRFHTEMLGLYPEVGGELVWEGGGEGLGLGLESWWWGEFMAGFDGLGEAEGEGGLLV